MSDRHIKRDEILSFKVGDTLSRYKIKSFESNGVANPLGEGGSSKVYLASQPLSGDVEIDRAIKFFIYRDDIAQSTSHNKIGPISKDDFLSEIVNISSVSHEYLPKVIDAGVWGDNGIDVPYIVTEYVSGPTLKELIHKKSERFQNNVDQILNSIESRPEIILEIMTAIGKGLVYLHEEAALFHCDIAPKNIFIHQGKSITPIIGDLGVARSLKQRGEKGIDVIGSKSFMPPDIVQHLEKAVSSEVFASFQPRWDIFSFGKTGLELCTLLPDGEKPNWHLPLVRAMEDCCKARYAALSEVVERLRFLHPDNRLIASVRELAAGRMRKLQPVEPVAMSKRMRRLVDHPALVRLAKVPQLTMAYQVFPGGLHTRYEHSLGVMETIRRYLAALVDQPEFLEHFSAKTIETCLLSGLLYNLSRYPFENLLRESRISRGNWRIVASKEDIIDELFSINDDKRRTIPDIIKTDFPQVDIQNLKNILTGMRSRFSNDDVLIYSMLNCSIDARVVDFVRRDSLHLGLTKADLVDLDELLAHLTVNDHRLALKITGTSIAEQLISQRYWLFNRIYWNRPNRQFVAMVRYVLHELLDQDGFSDRLRGLILKSNERDVLLFCQIEAEKLGLPSVKGVLDLLLGEPQQLYRLVLEKNSADDGGFHRICQKFAELSHADQLGFARGLGEEVAMSFPECSDMIKKMEPFLIDIPMETSDSKLGHDISVVKTDGSIDTLIKVSDIIGGIDNGFREHLQKLRVMIHPDLDACLSAKKNELRELVRSYLAKHTD